MIHISNSCIKKVQCQSPLQKNTALAIQGLINVYEHRKSLSEERQRISDDRDNHQRIPDKIRCGSACFVHTQATAFDAGIFSYGF